MFTWKELSILKVFINFIKSDKSLLSGILFFIKEVFLMLNDYIITEHTRVGLDWRMERLSWQKGKEMGCENCNEGSEEDDYQESAFCSSVEQKCVECCSDDIKRVYSDNGSW